MILSDDKKKRKTANCNSSIRDQPMIAKTLDPKSLRLSTTLNSGAFNHYAVTAHQSCRVKSTNPDHATLCALIQNPAAVTKIILRVKNTN